MPAFPVVGFDLGHVLPKNGVQYVHGPD
jgi:hypothetical protein